MQIARHATESYEDGDVTLKTQNEIGGCLTQQINTLLFVMACESLFYLLYQLRS